MYWHQIQMAPVAYPGMRWEVMQAAYTFSQHEEQTREWLGFIPFGDFGETVELLYSSIDDGVGFLANQDEINALRALNTTMGAVLDDASQEDDEIIIQHHLWPVVIEQAGELFTHLTQTNLRVGKPWPDEPTTVTGNSAYVSDGSRWGYYTVFMRNGNSDAIIQKFLNTGWSWFWRSSPPLPLSTTSRFASLTETRHAFASTLPYLEAPYDWLGQTIDLIAYEPEHAGRALDPSLIVEDVRALQSDHETPLRACLYQSSSSACFAFPRMDSLSVAEELIGGVKSEASVSRRIRLEHVLNLI